MRKPDPVHGIEHIERVFRLAERLALAEGADLEVVRAAALLHDALPPAENNGEEAGLAGQSQRQAHQHASASFAAQVLALRVGLKNASGRWRTASGPPFS